MAEFPALPLWTDAYLGDTTHLTTIEHGAYLLLLMTTWRTSECCLPDDDRLLSRYARLSGQQWKRMRPVIADFFVIEDGKWRQRRLSDERNAVKRLSERQAEKGRASGKARSLKTKGRHVTAVKSGSAGVEPETNRTRTSPTPTPLEKDRDKSLSKKPLSADWKPDEFGEGTQSRGITAGWPKQELERQLEAFRAHHLREGSRFSDWQAAWSTWVLNSARFAERDRDRGSGQRSNGGSSIVDQVLAEKEREERRMQQHTTSAGGPC